ncbi:MAG: hypothetical protein ACI94Y_000156 [Maribacter sp.]|jgi:hypothetical protein
MLKQLLTNKDNPTKITFPTFNESLTDLGIR